MWGPGRRAVALLATMWLAASGCSGGEAPRGRVLVVGIDGATLRVAGPMLRAGRLPHLARIASEGAAGPLRSIRPLASPRLWNTIATGKTAAKHGIKFFYFTEAGERQLYLSHHRKVHALWNIASDAGLSVAVVNWWSTYPPEVVRGVMVSDHALPGRLEELNALSETHVTLSGPRVYPETWRRRVQERLRERQGLTEVGDPFAGNSSLPPWMQAEKLSHRYGEDAAIVRVALEIESELRPNLLMVLLTGIDRVSHRLWGALEPPELYPERMRLTPEQREAAAHALRRYYEYTDALIGLLITDFGPDDLVVVASDHGYEAGVSYGWLTGDHKSERAQDGVLFMRGPGIPAGRDTRGVTILDITPTILAWLGLPVGQDMDGQVASFLEGMPVTTVATHDTHAIERVEAGPSGSEAEILEELRDLGYLE